MKKIYCRYVDTVRVDTYSGRHQAGDAHVTLAQPAHTANLDKDIHEECTRRNKCWLLENILAWLRHLLLVEVVDCEAVGGHHDHHRDVEREQRPYHLDNGYIFVN